MSSPQGSDHHEEGSKPLEEYTIPKATITRIMRRVLPQDSRVTNGAKETIDDCIVQFSTALTQAALQESRRNRRLTITADDLIAGLANLGLADYVLPMSEYLRLFRGNVINQKTTIAPPAPPAPSAPVAPTVQEETAVPPSSLDLTLQLGLPSMRDVTELAPRTNVYALWPGGAPLTVGTSLALMPPPAADDDDEDP